MLYQSLPGEEVLHTTTAVNCVNPLPDGCFGVVAPELMNRQLLPAGLHTRWGAQVADMYFCKVSHFSGNPPNGTGVVIRVSNYFFDRSSKFVGLLRNALNPVGPHPTCSMLKLCCLGCQKGEILLHSVYSCA